MSEKKYSSEDIYVTLKMRIVELHYQPGDILNEAALADEFGVSRTPIREVLQKLENEKLILIVPRVGAQVSLIDYKTMKYMVEVKRELEGLAAKLAARKISDNDIEKLEQLVDEYKKLKVETDYEKIIYSDRIFHEIIRSSAENPVLYKMIEDIHVHLERLWHYTLKSVTNMMLFTENYENIVKALKERNEEDAMKYAKEHVDNYIMQIKSELL